MVWPLSDQIKLKIEQAAELVHRLVVVVAPSGSGKTSALLDLRDRMTFPLLNVNLELSRRMLEMPERQRAVQLPQLLGEIVNAAEGDVVLMDNIEILFDVSLKQDPIRLLRQFSRNKTVVAAWNGFVDKGNLVYAVPGHPEHFRCKVGDLMVAGPEGTI